jgi:hypothetical protein
MFPTNAAPFKREINRLSNGIICIAKKHCYNKEIIYQNTNFYVYLYNININID